MTSHYLNQWCSGFPTHICGTRPQWIKESLHLSLKWLSIQHDDVIKWKHFPRYWPFVRRIHRSPVNSPHKGQWRGALMFSLICTRINGWVNNGEAGDLRRYRAHYDVTVTEDVKSPQCLQRSFSFKNILIRNHILKNVDKPSMTNHLSRCSLDTNTKLYNVIFIFPEFISFLISQKNDISLFTNHK